MKLAVGSKNPVKLAAVESVFRVHFPEAKVVGVEVASGVRTQPKSKEEIYQGALNRANNALRKVCTARFGVGIEGGIHLYPFGGLNNRWWLYVIARVGKESARPVG